MSRVQISKENLPDNFENLDVDGMLAAITKNQIRLQGFDNMLLIENRGKILKSKKELVDFLGIDNERMKYSLKEYIVYYKDDGNKLHFKLVAYSCKRCDGIVVGDPEKQRVRNVTGMSHIDDIYTCMHHPYKNNIDTCEIIKMDPVRR